MTQISSFKGIQRQAHNVHQIWSAPSVPDHNDYILSYPPPFPLTSFRSGQFPTVIVTPQERLGRSLLSFVSFLECLQDSLIAQLVKSPPEVRETWVWSLGWEDPWRRERLPTPVFWPGELHGECPCGCKASDRTDRLSLECLVHFISRNIFYFTYFLSIVALRCLFLLHSKVNQPHIDIHTLLFVFLSHLGHHGALSRVPCAVLWGRISYLFYTYQCIYVNCSLPVHLPRWC